MVGVRGFVERKVDGSECRMALVKEGRKGGGRCEGWRGCEAEVKRGERGGGKVGEDGERVVRVAGEGEGGELGESGPKYWPFPGRLIPPAGRIVEVDKIEREVLQRAREAFHKQPALRKNGVCGHAKRLEALCRVPRCGSPLRSSEEDLARVVQLESEMSKREGCQDLEEL